MGIIRNKRKKGPYKKKDRADYSPRGAKEKDIALRKKNAQFSLDRSIHADLDLYDYYGYASKTAMVEAGVVLIKRNHEVRLEQARLAKKLRK